MTTTSQPEGAKPPETPSVPDKGAAPEPKSVPLGEHIEMRQELRKAIDELASLKAELAKPKKTDDPAHPKAPSLEAVAQTVREMELRDKRRDVQGQLGLADDKQVDAVLKLMTEMALSPDEALAIAAKREPAVFASKDRPTGGEPQFGSLTPRPGAGPQPKPDDAQKRREYIQSLRGKDEKLRERYLDNQIGHHLGEALGWQHDLLQLPQP